MEAGWDQATAPKGLAAERGDARCFLIQTPARVWVLRSAALLVGVLLTFFGVSDGEATALKCGPGMVLLYCARGPVCAVPPAVCCGDGACGQGMKCLNCPGIGARCAIPPAECCGGGICGQGMKCLICARGPVCAVPPAVCCGDGVCGQGMKCVQTSYGPACQTVTGGGGGRPGGGGQGGRGGQTACDTQCMHECRNQGRSGGRLVGVCLSGVVQSGSCQCY